MAAAQVSTSPQAAEEIKWNDHLEKLIDLFKPFLLDTLRVSHLLCLLHIKEVKDVAFMIHKKENSGNFEAASAILLEAIKRSDEPGKWQMFIDALKEVEDTAVLQTLLDERQQTDGWLDNQDNRRLINLFSQTIVEHLALGSLLNKMRDKALILPQDIQQLRALINAGKLRHANAVLLLLLHRHSSDWYNSFLTILYESDHQELAEMIDPEFCQKKLENKKQGEPSGDQGRSLTSSGLGQPQLPKHNSDSGSVRHQSSGEQEGGLSSLGVNLGTHSTAKDKNIGAKQLPQPEHFQTVQGGTEVQHKPAVAESEPTCSCRCCAQVMTELKVLKSELAEVKALLGTALSRQPPQ